MMLRTSNYRKPSKPPGSDSNEPSGGLVRSAGCSGKKDGQSYMTNGGRRLIWHHLRTHDGERQATPVCSLTAGEHLCSSHASLNFNAQPLLSVRRPFGSQSPARALCVRRSFTLGDLQAAFHRDCRDSALKPPPKNVNGLPVGPRSSLSSTD